MYLFNIITKIHLVHGEKRKQRLGIKLAQAKFP